MTITEFLAARIAADEENAGRYLDFFPEGDMAPLFHRVLRECEAKRAIIKAHEDTRLSDGQVCWNCRGAEQDEWFREPWPCTTIKALAAIYSDHPEYQQEWKP